jgi:hypothetical protein
MSLFSGAFFIEKKGGEFHQTYRPFTKRGSRNGPQQPIQLIIFFAAKLKDIFIKGRDYPWPKPDRCPRCNSFKLWGHGFVTALFDDYNRPLFLKRYRCPACRCVIRLRPWGYFKRFQASVETIRSSISHRLKTGRWPPCFPHTRQGHWLRALRRKAAAFLNNTWDQGLLKAFDYLIEQGHIPVSRSI